MIKILSAPDRDGRVRYIKIWKCETHPYCPLCGGNVNDHVNPGTRCQKCLAETRGLERGQVFFAVPPVDEELL